MRRQTLAAGATMGVGATLMINALLGPLGAGLIRFHESAGIERQLLGGEMTSLFLAGPLALMAGALWLRGDARAPALAIGALGYALYLFIQLVLVPDYSRYAGNNERVFPLYLFAILASWVTAFEAWRELRANRLPVPSDRLRMVLGAAMTAISLLFALAWWATIVATYVRPATAEYLEHPTAFWLVRLMDLGFVIPLGLLTGVGLLGRKAWATSLAYAFTGVQALLLCAVAGMALQMLLARDPSMNGWAATAIVGAAGLFSWLHSVLMRA